MAHWHWLDYPEQCYRSNKKDKLGEFEGFFFTDQPSNKKIDKTLCIKLKHESVNIPTKYEILMIYKHSFLQYNKMIIFFLMLR